MKTFADLGLSPKALEAVKRMGYVEPTPVQEQAIPIVLAGRDLVAAAKTGTGKTGAFALPAMDGLGHAKAGSGPLMLVITPTRELAAQIADVCETIAASTHHRIACVVGGLKLGPQIDRLERGCDVLIATPGRLLDLCAQRAVRLADVRVLVLDEADRMLDMGFLPSVRKIVAQTPETRQTLLFSATIDRAVTESVGALLRDPATVEVAHKGDVADTVDQFIIRTPQLVKPALIKEVLAEKGADRVIVFARTRSRADATCRRLRRAGFAADAIHSDRTQSQRKRALERFAVGQTNIIVATDVLARGIDVEAVDYVINYDLPTQPEDYVHRIGRTGRAGKRGFAVSFVTPETEDALRDIEKLTHQRIPEMQLDHFDFEAQALEAAGRQQARRAGQDPEIAQAKRELAKRAKKERAGKMAHAQQAAHEERTAKSGAKRRRAKAKRNAEKARTAAKAGDARARKRASAQPGAGAANTGRGKAQAKAQSDHRPGRAHRADVAKRRSNAR